MIGGLVRAYPQPYLTQFNLLKYGNEKGECPSAPPYGTFFAPLPFWGRVRFDGRKLGRNEDLNIKEDAMRPYRRINVYYRRVEEVEA